MTQQARMRRLQDTLTIAGYGVIAFSVWSLAKTALFIILTSESGERQFFSIGDDVPMLLLHVVVGVILAIDLVVRAYVGLSARSEARGKHKSPIYLIVAAIAAMLNASSVITIVLGKANTFSFLDAVISAIIEATALTALILVIYCSIRLRGMRRASG